MARCGCGSSAVCSCVVTAGTGTTVTGSGSVASPYVVSATAVTTADTATVDLSAGTSPLTANVKLDTAAGNIITTTVNGIRVDCTAVLNCLDNGNGIGPIVGGLIQACLSTDVGNMLSFGADGCLFVPAGAFAGLNGVSCGLLGLGTVGSPLHTNTPAVWPFACADTNGADVYCGADGRLRTNPDVLSITNVNGQNNNVNIPLTTTDQTFDTTSGDITNPSTCCSALVITSFDFDADYDLAANTSAEFRFAGDMYWRYTNPNVQATTDTHWQGTRVAFNIIGPGATLTNNVTIQGRFTGSGPATVNRVQWNVRNALITLHQ